MTTLPAGLSAVYIALLITGVLAGWTFVIRYMVIYKWYSTELGIHLITFSSCLAAFESYYLLILIWPELPGRTGIRTGLFVLLTAAIVWRWWMFERIRWQSRKKKNQGTE